MNNKQAQNTYDRKRPGPESTTYSPPTSTPPQQEKGYTPYVRVPVEIEYIQRRKNSPTKIFSYAAQIHGIPGSRVKGTFDDDKNIAQKDKKFYVARPMYELKDLTASESKYNNQFANIQTYDEKKKTFTVRVGKKEFDVNESNIDFETGPDPRKILGPVRRAYTGAKDLDKPYKNRRGSLRRRPSSSSSGPSDPSAPENLAALKELLGDQLSPEQEATVLFEPGLLKELKKNDPTTRFDDLDMSWVNNLTDADFKAMEREGTMDNFWINLRKKQYTQSVKRPRPSKREMKKKEKECRATFCNPGETWKKCYRRQARKVHPDKGGDDNIFKMLQGCHNLIAKNVLSNEPGFAPEDKSIILKSAESIFWDKYDAWDRKRKRKLKRSRKRSRKRSPSRKKSRKKSRRS